MDRNSIKKNIIKKIQANCIYHLPSSPDCSTRAIYIFKKKKKKIQTKTLHHLKKKKKKKRIF